MKHSEHHNNTIFDQLDVHRLGHAFKKSLFFILPLFFLLGVGAYLFMRWSKPLYEATSTIQLEIKKDAGILGINIDPTKSSNSNSGAQQLLAEMEIIKSDFIFESLIDQLRLDVAYFEKGNVLIDEHFSSATYRIEYDPIKNIIPYDKQIFIEFIDTCSFEIYTNPEKKEIRKCNQLIELNDFVFTIKKSHFFSEHVIGRTLFFRINSKPSLKNYLKKGLEVKIRNSAANTINISFKDHNKTKATRIVNKIIDVYQEQSLKKKNQIQQQTIAFIDEQLENATQNLRIAEQNIESFVIQTGMVSPEAELSLVKEKMEEYKNAKKALMEEAETLDQIHAFITKEQSTDNSFPIVSDIDPLLNSSISQLNDLYREFELLKTTSKSNTAAYQNMIIRIQSVRESIMESVFQNQKMVQKRILELNDQLFALERSFKELPTKETEVTRLKRYFSLWEKFYLLLINKKVEYGIAMAGTVPEFTVLKPAFIPSTPIFPNAFISYLGAICLWVILSFLVIFINYLLSDTIISSNDLSRITRVSILGEIPEYTKARMNLSKLIVNQNPKSSISESFRNLRTNLKYLAKDITKAKQIISITSSISGEGKTFISVNLAGILALSGKKVIVLDVDLRKPKIHHAFSGGNHLGVSNLLIGQNNLSECIQKSEIPSLHYISAGTPPPNPSELILRPEFDTLIATLQEQYDYVIIDTPPIGLVTDGKLVMEKADVELYVVRAKYSKTSIIKEIDVLHEKQENHNIGIILNSINPKKSNYGYGYGYYQE